MPDLAQIYLLETRHFEAWVEGFLASKGAAVEICRSAADLPPPGDPRWASATVIVDTEHAGPAVLETLESCADTVLITGPSSRIRALTHRAASAGWELLVKPYSPEELDFRLNRAWSDPRQSSMSSDGAPHALIVAAGRTLLGCRYARLVEIRGVTVATLADSGDLSGSALVDRVVFPGRLGSGLAGSTSPQIIRERLPSVEFERSTRGGEVLVIPLRRGRVGLFLMAVQGLDGAPIGVRERLRAEAVCSLARALLSGAGETSYKRTVSRLLAHVPSGIMVLDDQGKVFSVNRQGVAVLAMEETQVVGGDAAQFLGLKKDDALVRAIKTNEPAMRMEQKVLLPNGKTMMLGVSVAPIEADEEVAKGSVLVFQDLSRLKRLEERVRRADQLASLGAMAAGMAHEIRNPLASVLTGVQILGSLAPSDPRAKRHTETIVQQITRVNRIVQDLLTLGRPAKSRIEAHSVDKAISHAVQGLGTRASDSGVMVHVEIPDPCPVALMDEGQIQQVLLNLLLNAVDAMPAGGELVVRVAERVETAAVRIEVIDTGEGISPEDIGQVFTPFFSTKAQGSGLGLSICNRIISDHGGQLDISSVRGRGTTVTLELPCPGSSPAGASASVPRKAR